jgi:hypothetical protein
MSYIYGVPCKSRNFNVVYIWTYVWQRWKPSLSICCTMFQHWINAENYPVSQLCVNTLPATKITLITDGISQTIYQYQITSCMCSEAGSEWDKSRFMEPGILLSRTVWRSSTAHLTWLSQTNRGRWRQTTNVFEFSVKSSIRNRYFPPCAPPPPNVNFVVQWNM